MHKFITPRVGSDRADGYASSKRLDFNPRSPCGERRCRKRSAVLQRQISIHAPRVGSDSVLGWWAGSHGISIHAPRVGSDSSAFSTFTPSRQFQSTLPVWGATYSPINTGTRLQNFNPRSPCGERHNISWTGVVTSVFQSTLPVWGATRGYIMKKWYNVISIHAPRVGSDVAQPVWV